MPIRVSADLLQLLTYNLYGMAWAVWDGDARRGNR